MRTEWSADSHINLRIDQLERMKRASAPVSVQIYTACERYRRGELELPQNAHSRKKCTFVAVHVKKRPDYSDVMIRGILDAHFLHPVDKRAEIARLDAEIAAMFNEMPKVPYVLENTGVEHG